MITILRYSAFEMNSTPFIYLFVTNTTLSDFDGDGDDCGDDTFYGVTPDDCYSIQGHLEYPCKCFRCHLDYLSLNLVWNLGYSKVRSL